MKVENTKQWCAELLKWAILIAFGLTGLYVISPRYEFLVSPTRASYSSQHYMIYRCDRITGEIALTDRQYIIE